MINEIKSCYKYLLSFFKKGWDIYDYPITFRCTKPSKFNLNPERFKPIPWSAQVINWPQMQGGGDTREEAFDSLVKNFEEKKKRNEKFPRPGTGLPIEFASTENISQFENIATDFFKRILEIDYQNVFVSDESSLWDFEFEDTLEPIFVKIREVYGVDVSASKGNLLEIFRTLSVKK